MLTDDEETALHEAGHVLAADDVGHRFAYATIEPDEEHGTAGHVPVEDLSPMTGAIIDYAGHAALVTRGCIGDMSEESASEHGAGRDFKRASESLDNSEREIEMAKTRAREIVTERRDQVELVARALLRHRRLDAQEIDGLLSRGGPFEEFWRRVFPHLFV